MVLLANERRARDAALAADKILLALSAPFVIDCHELYASTSIGISTFPLDGTDAATLIKNADTAMYHAKDLGRNNYQFYREDMNTRAVERQLIETNLRCTTSPRSTCKPIASPGSKPCCAGSIRNGDWSCPNVSYRLPRNAA